MTSKKKAAEKKPAAKKPRAKYVATVIVKLLPSQRAKLAALAKKHKTTLSCIVRSMIDNNVTLA